MKIDVYNHFNSRHLGQIEIDDADVEKLDTPPSLADKRRAEDHVVEVLRGGKTLRLFRASVNGDDRYMTNTPDAVAA